MRPGLSKVTRTNDLAHVARLAPPTNDARSGPPSLPDESRPKLNLHLAVADGSVRRKSSASMSHPPRNHLPTGFPALEMRGIEHQLYEANKYLCALNGEGSRGGAFER